ncbi:MAG TPA: TetR/AcrR family transcriptional regulator [Pseudonocardiaceae bacterium]|jgi:AcrR family transcriptional regulator|nr:TetR/AcrR family transcriptional regulator [Pseudonocardiaceae bacterium]
MAGSGNRGRPRDAEVDRRILNAARDLLLSKGYAALSIDEVAERAGSAKTTLYRRWPTKDHLILSVIAQMQGDVSIPDSGDLRADLRYYLKAVAGGLDGMRKAGRGEDADDRSAGLVGELAGVAARHRDLGELVRSVFERRNAVAIGLLTSTTERGALRADVDPVVLLDQLIGPIYYRVLVTGAPIDTDYIEALIDGALLGAEPRV